MQWRTFDNHRMTQASGQLSHDLYSEVATNAQTIVNYIMALLLDSTFSRMDTSSLGSPPLPHGNVIIPDALLALRPCQALCPTLLGIHPLEVI